MRSNCGFKSFNVFGCSDFLQEMFFHTSVYLPGQGAEVLSMEMSVTSGGPLAVILETGVATSTFPIIEAKTGNLESTLASLPLPKNCGSWLHDCRDCNLHFICRSGPVLWISVLRKLSWSRSALNLTGFQSRWVLWEMCLFWGEVWVMQSRCTTSPSAEVYMAS